MRAMAAAAIASALRTVPTRSPDSSSWIPAFMPSCTCRSQAPHSPGSMPLKIGASADKQL